MLFYLSIIDTSAVDAGDIILSIVGYFIVFFALVLLYTVFFFLPKIMKLKFKTKTKKDELSLGKNVEIELSGEVNAAISMALYLHFNQYHDEESTEMTIKRESRLYSPWSSKIYQVRNQFNRL